MYRYFLQSTCDFFSLGLHYKGNEVAFMDKLKETKTASELIFDGRILHLYRDDIMLPNGKPAERELIRHQKDCGLLPPKRI